MRHPKLIIAATGVALAVLWPPLTSAAPAAGLGGKLTVVNDAHSGQVAYNGHPLYTFIGDRPGQVTGQDTQGFFVVTPGIAPITTSPRMIGVVTFDFAVMPRKVGSKPGSDSRSSMRMIRRSRIARPKCQSRVGTIGNWASYAARTAGSSLTPVAARQ